MLAPSQTTPQHLISVADVDSKTLGKLFLCALKFKRLYPTRHTEDSLKPYSRLLAGYRVKIAFAEPSTRTSASHHEAGVLLGATMSLSENAGEYSSLAKGESWPDTIMTLGRYFDAIILRTREDDAAEWAAEHSSCPIINGGSGKKHHPTQAILDQLTLVEQFPEDQDVTLTLVGDLRFSRTIHSLIEMACLHKHSELGLVQRVALVGPTELDLPQSYKDMMDRSGIEYEEHTALSPRIVSESGAVYMTRTQLERMSWNLRLYYWWQAVLGNPLGAKYMFTPELARYLREDALLMHPLPRRGELPATLDTLPQLAIWNQVDNGLFVRMAILLWVFGKLDEGLEI